MFKNIPIYSVIVFTNPDCEIKVKNSNPYIKVCKLNNVLNILETNFKNSLVRNSMERIEEIFVELSQYSQMQEPILYDGKDIVKTTSYTYKNDNSIKEKTETLYDHKGAELPKTIKYT